eukprot:6908213-Lingulodinium_polyedra.AAC.1
MVDDGWLGASVPRLDVIADAGLQALVELLCASAYTRPCAHACWDVCQNRVSHARHAGAADAAAWSW